MCPDENAVFEYARGELAPAAQRALIEHTEGCEACRELIAHAVRELSDGGLAATMPDRTMPSSYAPSSRVPGVLASMRYRLVELLGSGGGGRVYKAYDMSLRRHVALKFLTSGSTEHARRIAREAQAQARVDHANVCKLFEIGDDKGRPFLVMQLVEGETLARAATEMTLEQKVGVMREVAGAVHAAHKLGILHRDVKPGNVLVERGEGGEFKPYVTDFGLARDMDDELTRTDAEPVGTPGFMAPEQARGERKNMDRRTDVYGLGATLFTTLAARPPFVGSTTEVLLKIAEEDPPLLRAIDPSIPRDLETIVAKCLEKDRARRYDSARALADDLARFLEGDPIEARPATIAYRLAKRVRKHRAAFAVAGLLVATLLVVVAVSAVRSRADAKDAAVAERLAREVERVDALARTSYMRPLHDTRVDRQRLFERVAQIQSIARQAGPGGEGIGHYALGRAYLALHEDARARSELEHAIAAGYINADVHAALGRALGALYERALADAQRIDSKQLREERVARAEADYKARALAELGAGRGAYGEPPELLEGLIAFYDKRYDDALARAQQALVARPELYEAKRLEGQVEAGRAQAAFNRGDVAATGPALARAHDAYRAAIDVARSDASLYEAEAERLIQQMAFDSNGAGPEKAFEAAMRACDDALAADPDAPAPPITATTALARMGEWAMSHDGDADTLIGRAIETGTRAVERNPTDALAHYQLGRAFRFRADVDARGGRDTRVALARAIEIEERASILDPTLAITRNELGIANQMLADAAIERGDDPRPLFDAAVAALEPATGARPDFAPPFINLNNTLRVRAEYEEAHGIDPTDSLERAIQAGEGGIRANPAHPVGYYNVALALLRRAEHTSERGGDPAPDVARVLDLVAKTIAIQPKYGYAFQAAGDIKLVMALHLFARGGNPTDEIRGAFEALEKRRAIDSGSAYVYRGLGRGYVLAAENALDAGRPREADDAILHARENVATAMRVRAPDPESLVLAVRIERLAARDGRRQDAKASLERAVRYAKDALAKNANDIDVLTQAARAMRDHGDLAEARALVDRARRVNPISADASFVEGSILVLEAQAERAPDVRKDRAARAKELLERALASDARLAREIAPWLVRPPFG